MGSAFLFAVQRLRHFRSAGDICFYGNLLLNLSANFLTFFQPQKEESENGT